MGSSCKKTLSENFICITLSSPRLSPLTVPLCFRQYSFLSVPSSLFFLPLIAFFFFVSHCLSVSLASLLRRLFSLRLSPPAPCPLFSSRCPSQWLLCQDPVDGATGREASRTRVRDRFPVNISKMSANQRGVRDV